MREDIEKLAIERLHKFCDAIFGGQEDISGIYLRLYLKAGIDALDRKIKAVSALMGEVPIDDGDLYLELHEQFQELNMVRTMLLKMLESISELLGPDVN